MSEDKLFWIFTATIVAIVSGILLIISGYIPQQHTVSEYEQILKTKETEMINHLPYSDQLRTVIESQMNKQIISTVSMVLPLESIISKFGGIAVIIGGVIFALRTIREITAHQVRYVGIVGSHIGRIIVGIGSGTGIVKLIIPIIAYYILTKQFSFLEHEFIWLTTTLSGIGVVLAVIATYLMNYTSQG